MFPACPKARYFTHPQKTSHRPNLARPLDVLRMERSQLRKRLFELDGLVDEVFKHSSGAGKVAVEPGDIY